MKTPNDQFTHIDIQEDLSNTRKLLLMICLALTAWIAVISLVIPSDVSWYSRPMLGLLGTLALSYALSRMAYTEVASRVYVVSLVITLLSLMWFDDTSHYIFYMMAPIPTILATLLLHNRDDKLTALITLVPMFGIGLYKEDAGVFELLTIPALVTALMLGTMQAYKLNMSQMTDWAFESHGKAEHRSQMYYSQRQQLEDALQELRVANSQLGTLNRQLDQARAQAEDANEVKSLFLASMSHELRTPLNSILNFSQFMLNGMMGDVTDQQIEALAHVLNSGKHLLGLINDVLDISKIEAGALELFVEDDVDLREDLKLIATTGRSLVSGKPVTFEIEADAYLPLIVGDRQRILQIVMNLVSNACKFTQEGEITVRAQGENGSVIVAVQDSGPGIAPEDQEAVFESFRQTKHGLTQGGGTGLGLSISRRLAEAHGGKLWLESEPGHGATFFVELPINSPELRALLHNKEN